MGQTLTSTSILMLFCLFILQFLHPPKNVGGGDTVALYIDVGESLNLRKSVQKDRESGVQRQIRNHSRIL